MNGARLGKELLKFECFGENVMNCARYLAKCVHNGCGGLYQWWTQYYAVAKFNLNEVIQQVFRANCQDAGDDFLKLKLDISLLNRSKSLLIRLIDLLRRSMNRLSRSVEH